VYALNAPSTICTQLPLSNVRIPGIACGLRGDDALCSMSMEGDHRWMSLIHFKSTARRCMSAFITQVNDFDLLAVGGTPFPMLLARSLDGDTRFC